MEIARTVSLSAILLALGCLPDKPSNSPDTTHAASAEQAKIEETIALCEEARGDERAVLLQQACEQEASMDPEKWLYLVQSLGGEQAAREALRYIDVSPDGVLRLLYPGSGSHIVASSMAAALMDMGEVNGIEIKGAEFTFTETSLCAKDKLKNVLEDFSRTNPDFKLETYTEKQEGEGVIQNYRLIYKDTYPITIRLLFNMTGEAWYADEDMDSKPMFIHDPAPSPLASLELVLDYYETIHRTGQKPTQIIMEDLTEYRQGRAFDLKFLGPVAFLEGSFGHRYNQTRRFSGFSESLACELERRGKVSREGVERARQDNNMEFYDEELGEMKTYNKVSVEVGEPHFGGGVVLEFHPEILTLDPTVFKLLVDLSFSANTTSIGHRRVGEAYDEDGERMINERFYGELFEHGKNLIHTMENIDSKLAPVLAIRMFQVLIKDKKNVARYIENNYPQDKQAGHDRVEAFLTFLKARLSPEVQVEVSKTLNAIAEHVSGGVRIKDESDRGIDFGRLMGETKDHWNALRDVAERLMEEAENSASLPPSAMNYPEGQVVGG